MKQLRDLSWNPSRYFYRDSFKYFSSDSYRNPCKKLSYFSCKISPKLKFIQGLLYEFPTDFFRDFFLHLFSCILFRSFSRELSANSAWKLFIEFFRSNSYSSSYFFGRNAPGVFSKKNFSKFSPGSPFWNTLVILRENSPWIFPKIPSGNSYKVSSRSISRCNLKNFTMISPKNPPIICLSIPPKILTEIAQKFL